MAHSPYLFEFILIRGLDGTAQKEKRMDLSSGMLTFRNRTSQKCCGVPHPCGEDFTTFTPYDKIIREVLCCCSACYADDA